MANMESKSAAPSRVQRWLDDPFHELERASEGQFASTPHDFGFGVHWGRTLEAVLAPPVNVTTTDGAVHVEADLPGLDPENIEVTVQDDVLTLNGQRKAAPELPGTHFYRQERQFGTIRRVVELPVRVDADHVTASYHDGVLRLDLPIVREEASGAHGIQITGG